MSKLPNFIMNRLGLMWSPYTHILPGLDDGAGDWDEALEMARIARADGVGTVVATPHVLPGLYDNKRDAILKAVKDFNQLLSERGISRHIFIEVSYCCCFSGWTTPLPMCRRQTLLP